MATVRLEENLYLVTTDSRGRALLPKAFTKGHRHYRVTEDEDGNLLLSPVVYVDKKETEQ